MNKDHEYLLRRIYDLKQKLYITFPLIEAEIREFIEETGHSTQVGPRTVALILEYIDGVLDEVIKHVNKEERSGS